MRQFPERICIIFIMSVLKTEMGSHCPQVPLSFTSRNLIFNMSTFTSTFWYLSLFPKITSATDWNWILHIVFIQSRTWVPIILLSSYLKKKKTTKTTATLKFAFSVRCSIDIGNLSISMYVLLFKLNTRLKILLLPIELCN